MLRRLTSKITSRSVKLALVGLFSLSSALFGLVSHASAETFDLVAEQGLQVSPVIIELNGEPGKSYSLDVNVMNVTGTELTYGTEFADFRAKDETGSPEIVEEGDLPEGASVRKWLSAIDTFQLGSHQRQALKVKVSIPKKAEPGGHYGVITFTGRVPGSDDEQVSVRVKTGILVLIRVAGDIKESLSLESFTATSKNSTPWFIENAPIDFTVRLKNTGNVHVKPSGTIEVRNMFGGLVGKTAFNAAKGNVLPDTVRRFEQSINKDWMVGRYTADLVAGYGTDGKALTSTIDFWVIPYKPLLALLALLITILFVLRRILKAYKRHVITEAEHEHDPVAEPEPAPETPHDPVVTEPDIQQRAEQEAQPQTQQIPVQEAAPPEASQSQQENVQEPYSPPTEYPAPTPPTSTQPQPEPRNQDQNQTPPQP